MSEKDVVENVDSPGEIGIPIANNSTPGIASFDSNDFTVGTDGKVSSIVERGIPQYLGKITGTGTGTTDLNWEVDMNTVKQNKPIKLGEYIMLTERFNQFVPGDIFRITNVQIKDSKYTVKTNNVRALSLASIVGPQGEQGDEGPQGVPYLAYTNSIESTIDPAPGSIMRLEDGHFNRTPIINAGEYQDVVTVDWYNKTTHKAFIVTGYIQSKDSATNQWVALITAATDITGAGIAYIVDIDYPHGEFTSVQYDTTDGIRMQGIAEYLRDDGKTYQIPTDIDVPLVAGAGVSLEKKENEEKIEIKSLNSNLENGTANVLIQTTDTNHSFKVMTDGRAKVQSAPVEDDDVVRKYELDTKFDKTNIVQATGDSTTDVMSQKAVTDELNKTNNSLADLKEALYGYILDTTEIETESAIPYTVEVGGTTYNLVDDVRGLVKEIKGGTVKSNNLFNINSANKFNGGASFSRNGNQITVSLDRPGTYRSANVLLDTSLVGKRISLTALAMTDEINNTCIRIQWVDNSGLADGIAIQSNIITGNSFQKLTLSAVVPESPGGNFNSLCIMFYSNYNASLEGVVTYSATFKDIMINLGDTALPYEPYLDGLKSVEYTGLEVKGKNLFDKSKVRSADIANGSILEMGSNYFIVQGNISDSPGTALYANGWFRPLFNYNSPNNLYLKAGDIVTISAYYTVLEDNSVSGYLSEANIYLYGVKSLSKTLSRLPSVGVKTRRSITYTIPDGGDSYYYLVFTLNSSKIKIENIQVELGDTATDYKQYREPVNILPLTTTLRGVDTYKDRIIITKNESDDYYTATKETNCEEVAYTSGDEDNVEYITDLTTTVKPLATPTTEVLSTTLTESDVMPLLELGGSVEIVNENRLYVTGSTALEMVYKLINNTTTTSEVTE